MKRGTSLIYASELDFVPFSSSCKELADGMKLLYLKKSGNDSKYITAETTAKFHKIFD